MIPFLTSFYLVLFFILCLGGLDIRSIVIFIILILILLFQMTLCWLQFSPSEAPIMSIYAHFDFFIIFNIIFTLRPRGAADGPNCHYIIIYHNRIIVFIFYY